MNRTKNVRILIPLISAIFFLAGFSLSQAEQRVGPLPPEEGTRLVMPASYEDTYNAFAEEFPGDKYSVARKEDSFIATPYNEFGAKVTLTFARTAAPDRTEARMIARQYNTPEALRKWELSVLKKVEAKLIAVKSSSAAAASLAPAVRPAVRSDVDELPSAMAQTNKNDYAIVIGIEEYRQKLPRADFAQSDARLMSEYLIKVMGYPEENVIVLTNEKALQSDLAKYFERWLPNQVEKDSTVFIYYSGHGAPDHRTGGAYLVPYDGDPAFISETGYPLKRMYDALGKLPAREIIVVLDSCFSGAGGRSVLAKGLRPLVINLQSSTVLPGNIKVLAASAGDQVSATYDEKGHGLFTYFMLKGIKNEAVIKKDGTIRLDDLFGYLKPQVERVARKQYNNEQTPQLIVAPPVQRESYSDKKPTSKKNISDQPKEHNVRQGER